MQFVMNVMKKIDFYQIDVNNYWESNEEIKITRNIFKIY